MSHQQPKRFRHKRRPRPFNVQRTLRELARNPVNHDELGSSAIRRFLDPAQSAAYEDIAATTNKLWDGKVVFAETADAGITLMRKSEIDRVRGSQKDFTIGKLGSVSYGLSRHIIKEMLPDTATDETPLVIDKFIVSRPKGKFRFLVASLCDAGTVPAERNALEHGIDVYERVTHEWPLYQAHVTLGKIAVADFRPGLYRVANNLTEEFHGASFVARPAE